MVQESQEQNATYERMNKVFEDFPKIINTITELTKVSDLNSEYEILSNSERSIEQVDYDNWNGGTDFYNIYLSTSIEAYSRHESNLKQIEDVILDKVKSLFRNYPNSALREVIITPRLSQSRLSPQMLYKTKDDYAFISYQTDDKLTARNIKEILEGIGIEGFLAHENINVSEEWENKILEEMAKVSIFICLLSQSYLLSPWCMQEAGVAAFRNITIIPLSLGDVIPTGFIRKYQAVKIDKQRPRLQDLVPGLLKYNKFKGLNIIIELIGASGSFRGAEENFELILPYIDDLTEIQMKKLLNKIRENGQIHHASLCAKKYIPMILKKYGNLLSDEDLDYLKNICKQYNGIV